jgi:dephospho-CoA kinase
MTRIIGLTGGIASGKSTASARFAELGVPVVDADELAREVVERGSEGLAEVVRVFGADVLDREGALDRKKLGTLVFEDPALRRKLEEITHPRIAALSTQRMAAIAASDVPYGLYEAALLVEKGTHRAMNGLVVVAASPEIQLGRVMKRDGLDETAARARLASQMPLEQKLAAATWIIWNDGDLEALRARVDEVHRAILEAGSNRDMGPRT